MEDESLKKLEDMEISGSIDLSEFSTFMLLNICNDLDV
jgi:hypothetical protein